jgi:N-acetylglucosaminyl-diphospho-decaprenol L-rhamnosyltransferase
MELSIIIVNWNSKDYLSRALASVEASLRGIDHEVVVIDSGSFDGCEAMLRSRHPEVRFIQSERNLGFGRANNEAARSACGKVLLFLNPDTEVRGHAIEQLLDVLHATPGAGIVGPKLVNADGSVQDTCIRAFPTVLNQLLDSDLLRLRFPNARLWGKQPLAALDGVPRRVDAVSGACLMVRRVDFDAVGMFSNDYFMYAEDMDFCLKMRRAGLHAYYVPRAIVVHLGGGSSSQAPANKFAAVMQLESQWRFFRKMRSPRYAALYRASMAGASAMRIALLLLVWPLHALRGAPAQRTGALRKWAARLRWTLGGERWVRDY